MPRPADAQLWLGPDYYAKPDGDRSFHCGEVRHIARSEVGSGSVSTPIARFFVWHPDIGAEGFHDHWRVECFIRDHPLAPDGKWLGRRLTDALVLSDVVAEPIWIEWHRIQESQGEARGEVFDWD